MKKLMMIACLAMACGCEQKAAQSKCGEEKCDSPKKSCEVEKIGKVAEPVALAPAVEVTK